MESRDHARLGPSAAHRWIHCPASVKLCESLDAEAQEGYSTYAAEGTAAHSVAEMVASHRFGLITDAMLEAGLAAWRGQYADAGWLEPGVDIYETEAEMVSHAGFYADVIERERARQPYTEMHLELKVFPGVPSVWGTGDCVLIGPDEIAVIDYKYGTGVKVEAPENPQLMLYGLGGLEADLLGLAKVVRIIIVQPRLDHVSVWETTVADLLNWRETVAIPAAELAVTDGAPFGPGEEACRFCPARGRCKAQMEWIVNRDFGQDLDLMDDDDYAEAIRMLPAISAWCTAVEENALQRIYTEGRKIPGFKVVVSGGQRKITDPAAAIEKLVAAGYEREKVVKPPVVEIQTLGVLDKVVKVGRRKVLAEVLGPELLGRTPGRPSLAPEDDARPAVTAASVAADDFDDGFEDTADA